MAVMMEFKKPTWESNSHKNTMDTDTSEMMWGVKITACTNPLNFL